MVDINLSKVFRMVVVQTKNVKLISIVLVKMKYVSMVNAFVTLSLLAMNRIIVSTSAILGNAMKMHHVLYYAAQRMLHAFAMLDIGEMDGK